MGEWFLRSNGVIDGPYSEDELLYLRDRGRLNGGDELRQGASGIWTTAKACGLLLPGAPAAEVSAELRGQRRVSLDPGVKTAGAPTEAQQNPVAAEMPVSGPPKRRSALLSTRQRTLVAAGVALIIVLLLILGILLNSIANQSGVAGGGGGSGSGPGGAEESASGSVDASSASQSESENPPPESTSPNEDGGSSEPIAPPPLPVPRPPRSSRFVTDDTDEMSRRLQREGAQHGDVQVSLMWSNMNDLDLHVVAPSGEIIMFDHKRSRCGGELDVDMNAASPVNEPIENVFWRTGQSPRGEFEVRVHHFAYRGAANPTEFLIVVTLDGAPRTYRGSVASQQMLSVCRFER